MKKNRFSTCASNYIDCLRKEGRYSTAHVYKNAVRSFSQFCGTQSIEFTKINRENLKRYSNYLTASRLKPNTISTYMRMLRCIYNRGVDARQAPYVHGLFRDVFTGVDTRQKKALPLSELHTLLNKDPQTETLRHTQAIANLLFQFGGMPFVDLAHLEKSNLNQGLLKYNRMKTGTPMSVEIIDSAYELLSLLRNNHSSSCSDRPDYLFHILSGEYKRGEEGAYREYQSALRKFNNHLKSLSRKLRLHSSVTSYTLRHMWGTAGILYNRAYVSDSVASSWECLWNKKHAGKILMKDSYRDAYGTAIIHAHAKELEQGTVTVEELMNDYSPQAMELAEKYLKALKPNIAGWEADFGKEMMTKNKAWLNMTWSGDAIWAIEEANAVGVDLDYEVPDEGSNIWYDGWVIPKYAKNPQAASYFINFMCRPDIALRNMDFCGYVSSIATPEILEEKVDTTLDYYADLSYFFGPGADSIQIDKIQYPDRKVVERCAMIRDFGDKTKEVLDIWSRIKGDNLGVGITILIFIVVALMSGWMIYKRWQRYNRQKQQRRRRRRKK